MFSFLNFLKKKKVENPQVEIGRLSALFMTELGDFTPNPDFENGTYSKTTDPELEQFLKTWKPQVKPIKPKIPNLINDVGVEFRIKK